MQGNKATIGFRSILILAFLEGASVISVELLGGKMLAPFYGTSLYIWTSIIGVTLFCLTLGYYIGGVLSKRINPDQYLFKTILLAAIAIMLMPIVAKFFYQRLIDLNVFVGCILLSLLLLGPSLILLGATSPLLIQLAVKNNTDSGRIAGLVYTSSTAGGIINVFALGFFLIPFVGIKWPLLLTSFILFIATIPFIKEKKQITYAGALLLVLIVIIFLPSRKGPNKNNISVVHHSEGLLGQLKVVDYTGEAGVTERALLSNNSPQSIITKTNVTVVSKYNYVHFISTIATLKSNPEVLLFGMAGGSLVYELQQQNSSIDVVDIDSRMFDIAQRYFYLQKLKTNTYTDDARHYIRTCKKKYDLIIIDISASEVQPSYLYTSQSFNEIKKLLNPGGFFCINFQGKVNDKSNLALATWSVFNTLKAAGYHSYFYNFTNNKDDVQFISSPLPIDFKKLVAEKINTCCLGNLHVKRIIKNEGIDSTTTRCLVKPLLLDDDLPLMERLKFEAVTETRRDIIKGMDKKEIKFEIDFFY